MRLSIVVLCLCLLGVSAHGASVFGDVNGDEEVNAVDIQLVINAVLGIPIDPSYNPDVNGDEEVNAIDIQLVINVVLGIPVTPPVDDETLPPLNVKLHLDEHASASALVTREGGVLETTDAKGAHYQLTIPENALAHPTEITLTPVTDIEDFPFSGGLKAAAHFEPQGLVLFAPAILEITHADHPEPGTAAGFAYHAKGEDFHLRPVEYDGDTARFRILHFSGVGHGEGTEEERREQGRRQAASRQQETDQALAETLENYTADQQRGERREMTEEERLAVLQVIQAQYHATVYPFAQEAVQNDTFLYCALQEYTTWSLTADGFPHFPEVAAMRTQVEGLLSQGFFNAILTASLECSTDLNPGRAADMLAWHQLFLFSRLAAVGAAHLDWGFVESAMKGCLRFELQFEATGDAEDAYAAAVSSGPHLLLELADFPDPYTLFGEYRLQGEGMLNFDSLDMECLASWTSMPGSLGATAYPQLPTREVRSCPVLPAWEPLSFRVYIWSETAPTASFTIQCDDDDTPYTSPPSPLWSAAWTLANLQRVDYTQGHLFTEWNTATGRNPIAWLSVTGHGAEGTQADTNMEIHHTPH